MKRSLMVLAAAIFLVLLATQFVHGYPDGAPDTVCDNELTPGHGRKETGVSPYQVSASSGRYSANKPIRVRIESLTGDAFQGFVVQAQDQYGEPILNGQWRSHQGKSIAKCGAITHTDPHKKQEVSLTWTPTSGSGSVTFVATIAKSKKLYYHNIKADVVGGSESSSSSSSQRKPSRTKPSFRPPTQQHHFQASDDTDFTPQFKATELREEFPRPSHTSSSWGWSMHPHRSSGSSSTKQARPPSNAFFEDSFADPSRQSFHRESVPLSHQPSSFDRAFNSRPFGSDRFQTTEEREGSHATHDFSLVRSAPIVSFRTSTFDHSRESRPHFFRQPAEN